MVTGIHEEVIKFFIKAQEDQIFDLFSEFGSVKNLHVNLDRKTGYLKGYAMIEYELLNEAQKAIKKLNGEKFMTRVLNVDFAFKKPPEIEQRSKNNQINLGKVKSDK